MTVRGLVCGFQGRGVQAAASTAFTATTTLQTMLLVWEGGGCNSRHGITTILYHHAISSRHVV